MVTPSKAGPELSAHSLDRDLRAIRRILRQPVESEIARGGLTGPQVAVVQILVHRGALSLKELSRHAGLAHSTVSGIVDRLVTRGILRRTSDEKDARFTSIAVTRAVDDYLRNGLPALTLNPLADAMRRATPAQRKTIVAGIATLRALLESPK